MSTPVQKEPLDLSIEHSYNDLIVLIRRFGKTTLTKLFTLAIKQATNFDLKVSADDYLDIDSNVLIDPSLKNAAVTLVSLLTSILRNNVAYGIPGKAFFCGVEPYLGLGNKNSTEDFATCATPYNINFESTNLLSASNLLEGVKVAFLPREEKTYTKQVVEYFGSVAMPLYLSSKYLYGASGLDVTGKTLLRSELGSGFVQWKVLRNSIKNIVKAEEAAEQAYEKYQTQPNQETSNEFGYSLTTLLSSIVALPIATTLTWKIQSATPQNKLMSVCFAFVTYNLAATTNLAAQFVTEWVIEYPMNSAIKWYNQPGSSVDITVTFPTGIKELDPALHCALNETSLMSFPQCDSSEKQVDDSVYILPSFDDMTNIGYTQLNALVPLLALTSINHQAFSGKSLPGSNNYAILVNGVLLLKLVTTNNYQIIISASTDTECLAEESMRMVIGETPEDHYLLA